MSTLSRAQAALNAIEPRKIASTDQQLQHAQTLALLAIAEELSRIGETGDPGD